MNITPILLKREELLLQSFNKETIKNHKRLNIYCRIDTSNIVFNNIYTPSKSFNQ